MNVAETKSFFDGHLPPAMPADASEPSFEQLMQHAEALTSRSYPLDTLLPILHRENQALGADKSVLKRLTESDPETMFVVAGQQAGLFGGPLYTLYKALHAIRLAERLETALHRPVLPVLWIASDDHDFEEVAQLGIRTDDGTTDRISYIPEGYREGMPVGDIVLDEDIFKAVKKLETALPSGRAGDAYRDMLIDCWTPGRSWGEAFARQYAALLSAHGLVLFDPRWDGVKALFGPVFETELSHPLRSTAVVNKQADMFERAAERKRAIRKRDDATNLFIETDGIRDVLAWNGEYYRAAAQSWDADSLLQIAAKEPNRFSPGAAIRPVCQDTIMPVIATIGGPGERHYLAQIEPVYHLFDVLSSIVWPRSSFTFIDRKTLRNAAKEHMPVQHLFRGRDRIEADIARKSFPTDIEDAFDMLDRHMDGDFKRLAGLVSDVDGSLAGAVEKEHGRAAHLVNGLRNRVLKAHKAALDTTSHRLHAATYFLCPNGGPQERWFGTDAIVPVLDELGIDTMIELTSPGEHRHRIVTLE